MVALSIEINTRIKKTELRYEPVGEEGSNRTECLTACGNSRLDREKDHDRFFPRPRES